MAQQVLEVKLNVNFFCNMNALPGVMFNPCVILGYYKYEVILISMKQDYFHVTLIEE